MVGLVVFIPAIEAEDLLEEYLPAFTWGSRCAVCLTKAKALLLAIEHTNVTTKTIEYVFSGTNCVGLINKVDMPHTPVMIARKRRWATLPSPGKQPEAHDHATGGEGVNCLLNSE